MNENQKPPRITYLRDKTGFPVVCLVYSRVVPGTLHFALSCHNPEDKYSKKRAREIALGRFNKSPNVFLYAQLTEFSDVLYDLVRGLAGGYVAGQSLRYREAGFDYVSARVQKAAANYLDYIGRRNSETNAIENLVQEYTLKFDVMGGVPNAKDELRRLARVLVDRVR